MFKKIFYALLAVIAIALISLIIYVYSGPKLPEAYEPIVQEVLANEIPELVKGNAGWVESDGVTIWYEEILPEDTVKGTIMLYMGISSGALSWPAYFLNPLIDSGYRLIRYDHRGLGQSDWLPDWEENPYSLKDMGQDALAIMDHLNIEKAHHLGVSMGGMIAQSVVINYPERSESLISIMSSGYIEDPTLKSMSFDVVKELIRLSIRYGMIPTEENMVKLQISSRHLLMGKAKYTLDAKAIGEETLYIMRKGGGFNSNVSGQHSAAVTASGSRYEELKKLTLPTLIIHGKADPLIPIEHGEKCAKLIPGAKTLWVENMGHDIPPDFVNEVLGSILGFIE